ncbi:MAG: N-acetylglutaminylglutamine amidotransferase [Desulfobacteraceae bacterium]|jgi:asparagine synthase (glutamine-hydrolysing)|nr:N-acetylglutaminylglutamine amidotransferase [Desulfobacteraceae bacterium]
MCGICGELSFNGSNTSAENVKSMMDVLASRGPDAMGMFLQGNVSLGHRRLKIIDLSEKAQQPMVDSTLGLSIVYNGAIYNYVELRRQLEETGYIFFSSGDTEVILKAYHAWGKDCLKRFNGMFAFAIHHRDSGRVFLARDRLGIKPLYYIKNSDKFRFASSLPALLASGDVDTDIDPVALNYFMTFHSVVPPPRTILKGIRKLAPASTMTIENDGSCREEKYWDLKFTPNDDEVNYSFADWKQQLLLKLEGAIRRRLTADVPVGVLLSGGVDSSLVVGLLSQAGQNNLNTFSIGFESAGGEEGNEFQYSDIIADHYGTEHHKIEVGSSSVLPSLERCVSAMSEPMVSHDCIGFYLLSEEVSRHVKVVQSGQGADEIFAGYYWYPPLMESSDLIDEYARVFFDRNYDEYIEAVHPRFAELDYSSSFIHRNFSKSGAELPIDKALRLDTTVMLIDDPVKRVDNMTMAWGLEARVPFLDHDLVELAASIPAEFKVSNGGKHILKEVARDIIPAEVIDRPKGYFPVPVLKYFRGEYFDFVNEIMNAPVVKEREIFNRDYVNSVLENPDGHITPLRGSKLWQMALLEYWLSVHNV